MDQGWTPADQAAFDNPPKRQPWQGPPPRRPYTFKSRPIMMGAPQPANVNSSAILQWLVGDDIIHVYVGGEGNDVFHRRAEAAKCLYLGFGGNDVVALSDSVVPIDFLALTTTEAAKNNATPVTATTPTTSIPKSDRLIDLDGQSLIPTLESPLESSTTTERQGR